jgi:molybdenum cofactor cytidylyltransferase
MTAARAVILAAGISSRMGRQKLLMVYESRRLIEHPITAARAWNPVVVCGAEVAQYLRNRSDLELVRNDAPELGMSRSLALANRVVARNLHLIVLLGDQPLVSEELIRTILRSAPGADVTYPRCDGVPGHPVVLSPRARRRLGGLPAGDTLRLVHRDPRLVANPIATEDRGAFFDVDTAG